MWNGQWNGCCETDSQRRGMDNQQREMGSVKLCSACGTSFSALTPHLRHRPPIQGTDSSIFNPLRPLLLQGRNPHAMQRLPSFKAYLPHSIHGPLTCTWRLIGASTRCNKVRAHEMDPATGGKLLVTGGKSHDRKNAVMTVCVSSSCFITKFTKLCSTSD